MSDSHSPTIAGLGIGANLGDAQGSVRAAIAALASLPGTRLVKASSLYRTAPWGVTDQPDFINACALVETVLSPRDLLDACLAIERGMGRDRGNALRWGPRLIDIDVLFHGATMSDEPRLQLPHPRLFERGFVLAPLSEIDPGLVIGGRKVADALVALGKPDWVRLSG
jgi:2-amino-4-hydroxy-6-hydroxymethyldihydropteridine diphosphokinase